MHMAVCVVVSGSHENSKQILSKLREDVASVVVAHHEHRDKG